MCCIPEVYVVEYYANGQEVRQMHIDIHEQSEDYLAQLVNGLLRERRLYLIATAPPLPNWSL